MQSDTKQCKTPLVVTSEKFLAESTIETLKQENETLQIIVDSQKDIIASQKNIIASQEKLNAQYKRDGAVKDSVINSKNEVIKEMKKSAGRIVGKANRK